MWSYVQFESQGANQTVNNERCMEEEVLAQPSVTWISAGLTGRHETLAIVRQWVLILSLIRLDWQLHHLFQLSLTHLKPVRRAQRKTQTQKSLCESNQLHPPCRSTLLIAWRWLRKEVFRAFNRGCCESMLSHSRGLLKSWTKKPLNAPLLSSAYSAVFASPGLLSLLWPVAYGGLR